MTRGKTLAQVVGINAFMIMNTIFQKESRGIGKQTKCEIDYILRNRNNSGWEWLIIGNVQLILMEAILPFK